MPLTWEELQHLQEAAMADDVELHPRMLEWSRESAAAHLESGGDATTEIAAIDASSSAYSSPAFAAWLGGLLPGVGMSGGLPGEGPTATPSGANRQVPCRPRARCRMFAFYGVADVAMSLEPWLLETPPWLEVRANELPGHGVRSTEPVPHGEARASLDRELISSEFRALVSQLADELSPLAASAPYLLFGFSFGALVAFGVAQELQRRACRPPLSLLVAGRGAPHCVFMRRAELELLATRPAEEVLRWMGESWAGVDLTLLPPSRLPRAAQLFRCGGLLGGVPLGDRWEGDDAHIPAHASNPPSIDAPIFAVGSSADKLWPARLHPEWAGVTSGAFRSVALHGVDHSRLMNDPGLKREMFRHAAVTVARHALIS